MGLTSPSHAGSKDVHMAHGCKRCGPSMKL